jgi:membrane protein implicated in regulation of membrane protease activity
VLGFGLSAVLVGISLPLGAPLLFLVSSVVFGVLLVVSAVLAIAVGRRRENERILDGRADGTAQNGH